MISEILKYCTYGSAAYVTVVGFAFYLAGNYQVRQENLQRAQRNPDNYIRLQPYGYLESCGYVVKIPILMLGAIILPQIFQDANFDN